MKKLLVLPLLAASLTACGDGGGGRSSARTVLPSMIAECGGPSKVVAFSDIGEGSYGATSSWAMICTDGRIVARDD